MSIAAPVQRIIDQARVNLPGALDGVLRMLYFNTVKTFTQRTDIWEGCVEVDVVPDCREYLVPAFDYGMINRLMWLEGKKSPATGAQIPPHGPMRKGALKQIEGYQAILTIYDLPSTPECWTAHLALTVVDPTDQDGFASVPTWVIEKYHNYIVSGMISEACAQPAKPYTSKELVMLHGRIFNEGIALARKEARTGSLYDGQRWAFPQQFYTHSQKVR